jgi:hypothetical protein
VAYRIQLGFQSPRICLIVYVISWIVGERLLAAGSLTYIDGTPLKVARRSTRPADNDDQTHPAIDDDQTHSTSRKSENREPRTVEVRGLTETITVDHLHLYFENYKRSGGGPIEDFTMHGKFALITFKNATGKLTLYLFSCSSSL